MNQLNYIIKRILQIIPVLFLTTILIFVMIHLIPGDPARLMLGEKATESAVAALREKLGLNRSLTAQYFQYLKGLLTFDLGTSLTYQRPVAQMLKERIPVTLSLTLMSTILSLLISFPLGYLAGIHKDKPGDHVVRGSALVAIAMPSFWVALLLMLLFSVKLRWLPAGGWGTTVWDHIRGLILPSLTQAIATSAILIRNIRNSVVEISVMDYVDFARSKGISEKEVRDHHILRNTLISTVTLLSMRVAYMLGGSVILETIYALPGIGKLMVDSIFGRDYVVVQALVFLFAFLVLVINLLTDILYSILDPRVRF
ncbi:MAG: ABC transporter permease [Sphaerochaeta sp.]|jgi:peptide/nickel transport system permease protein|nr:ABC transporter permease [Sphaerochaeta sp.]MCI2045500.1 ABC transporter permease [Sphaerochaeta sp.]MCI2076691.1 ABC transporter permease [Sphaerochaeta sp.]MCI2096509.1 ABC transporter permease [Sphaerochaeta sp.]MCI2104137.1 ABC transporter permease [Sphaerochaeta sp.]